jgi:hypothetical protein
MNVERPELAELKNKIVPYLSSPHLVNKSVK